MLTRCPNPKCKLVFEVADEREGKNAPCPQCGQVITIRSLAVLKEVERQQERLHAARQDRSGLVRCVSGAPVLGAPETRPTQAQARFSALLEDIRSLWNVGSMFRSADGAGFGKLYLCGITGCPPRKEIAKTSLGAEEVVEWEHAAGALDVLPALGGTDVTILALEKTETSVPLRETLEKGLIRAPLCMLVGNEVSGVSAEALACAQQVCHLPMRGAKTSLNAAVAFGIAAYMVREFVE